MIRIRRYGSVAALLLAIVAAPLLALAQPAATINANLLSFFGPAQTVASTATFPTALVWEPNGSNCMTVRVAGTNTGLAATVQVTNTRTGTPAWNNTSYVAKGGAGGSAQAIVGDGLYAFDIGGAASARLNITALSTGSVVVSASATPAACISAVGIIAKATYSASFTALAPAASATDFATITGNANTTVKVTHVDCTGIATTEGIATVELLTRSTANTGTAAANPVAVPHDSNDAASQAAVATYTTNPSVLGTLVGPIRYGKLLLPLATSTVTIPSPVSWDFGNFGSEPIVLRGATAVLALNGAAATFPAGTALSCSFTWTEQ